jgi:hypothetical protein
MLMPMDDNNNSNNPQSNISEAAPASPTPDNLPETEPSPSTITPTNQPTLPADSPIVAKPTAKKSHFKLILGIIIVLILFGAATTAAFYVGKHKRIVVIAAVKKNPINLPPQAIVISQCTPGRGKQYIIPKDIPNGPIYDVQNSQVIAIEYVLGFKALLSNSDAFSNTILQLTARYPVDHFTILPVPPKPTDTDQYIRLIVFVVSKTEANSITCK